MHRYLIDIIKNTLKNSNVFKGTADGIQICINGSYIDISKEELQEIYSQLDDESKTKLMASILGSHG